MSKTRTHSNSQAVAPVHTSAHSSSPKSAGLTDDQVRSILEKVASTLDLACDICRIEALRFADHDSCYGYYALESMLCGIGALADMASGEGVVGDLPTWLCGPSFHLRNGAASQSVNGGAM